MLEKTLIVAAIALAVAGMDARAAESDEFPDIRRQIDEIGQSATVEVDSSVELRSGESGLSARLRSHYDFVSGIARDNLRYKYAKRYICIYRRALKRGQRVLERIERRPPRVRDRIKSKKWYRKFVDRMAWYRSISKGWSGRELRTGS